MSVATFLNRPVSLSDGPADPTIDPSLLTPGSFTVSAQLLQDAVAANGVSVGDGAYNQEALFANPFKDGREEALVIDEGNFLTYLQRTDTSDTGWAKSQVVDDSSTAYSLAEVVVVRHPSGDMYAVCSPQSASEPAFCLKLVLSERLADGTAMCTWTDKLEFPSVPSTYARSLCVSYAPDTGPVVLAGGRGGGVYGLGLYPVLPGTGTVPWVNILGTLGVSDLPLAGGGLVPYRSQTGQSMVVIRYYLNGQTLIREELNKNGTTRHATVSTNVQQFCGTFYVPYFSYTYPRGDVGFAYLDTLGNLVTGSGYPGEDLQSTITSGLGFAGQTTCWQDADGLLHVFGLDSGATLRVLHSTSWRQVANSMGSPYVQPQWTSAVVAGAPSGIGGFDLMNAADRLVAFDFTGSGTSDHLFAYGPGTASDRPAVAVLEHVPNGFTTVYEATGVPGYSFDPVNDDVVAIDYTGSGSADHLLIYNRLGNSGAYAIVKGVPTGDGETVIETVATGFNGLAARYPEFTPEDRIVAFDYGRTGKNEYLLAYRPGAGQAFLLTPSTGTSPAFPYEVVKVFNGGIVPGFNLMSYADLMAGFDFNSTGSATHLLMYRPGTGLVCIATSDGNGGLKAVITNTDGIGGWDLAEPEDRLVPFDYTGSGCNDHILSYRPGNTTGHSDGQAWVLAREGTTNNYLVPVRSDSGGLGGYDFRSAADTVTGLDYAETGGLSFLVAYRPGTGKVSVIGRRGGQDVVSPVYQAPPNSNIPVTVGLHAKVVDFQLDPYPDYKPSELIKMEGATDAEAYCVCTQDVTTSQWQTDKVRLPAATPDTPAPVYMVSHYLANATLLDRTGRPMGGHNVSVSANTLVEVQLGEVSYQVGPGRAIVTTTDASGKLVIAIAARGLNPPTVHLNADGLERGTAIDFASDVNNFLAGNGSLPSQTGTFTAELLETAQTHSNTTGTPDEPLADWTKLKDRGLTPQVVIDHCTTVYGQAAGSTEMPKVVFDGCDEPQPIIGYVIQLWNPDRPAFQAFRTQDELDGYKAQRSTHPSYGGLWDDFTGWASDVWEGIKTGATQVAEVIVSSITEIAVMVGDAIVSLGEMIIEAIEQAIQVVEAVFQMIADAVMSVIDWLKSLFAVKDIWDTKTVIESVATQSISFIAPTITHYQGEVSGWFAQQKQEATALFEGLKVQYRGTRLGDFQNSTPSVSDSTGTSVSQDSIKENPQANWMSSKISGMETRNPQLFDSVHQGFGDSSILDQIIAAVTSSGIPAVFESFETLLLDLFSFDDPSAADHSLVVDLIDVIEKIALAVLSIFDQIVSTILGLVAGAAKTAFDLLTAPLDIPVVTQLYNWIVELAGAPEEDMSILRLMSLAFAFFGTVIYKLCVGVDSAPFPRDANGNLPAFTIPAPPWMPTPPPNAGQGGAGAAPQTDINFMALLYNGFIGGIGGWLTALFGGVFTDAAVPGEGTTIAGKWPFYVNFASLLFGVLVPAFPPMTGTAWGTKWYWDAIAGTLCIYTAMEAVCLGFPIALKNAGVEPDDSPLPNPGSMCAFLIGCLLLGFQAYAVSQEGDEIPVGLQVTLIAGPLPMIFQIVRAIVKKVTKAPDKRLAVCAVLAGVNAVVNTISFMSAAITDIIELVNAPQFTGAGAVAEGEVGMNFEYTLQASGGTGEYHGKLEAGSSLPDELEFEQEDGKNSAAVVGVPVQSGTFPVSLRISDSFTPPLTTQAGTVTFTIAPTPVGSMSIEGDADPSMEAATLLAEPFAVTVYGKPEAGKAAQPLADAVVRFSVGGAPAADSASGAFYPAGFDASPQLTWDVVTDEEGTATAPSFCANGVTGTYEVTAQVPGTNAKATFNVVNTASTITDLVAASGTPQSTSAPSQALSLIYVPGGTFDMQIIAKVTAGGNPCPNVLVTFSVPALAPISLPAGFPQHNYGAFSDSGTQQHQVLTDEDGRANAGLFTGSRAWIESGDANPFTVTAQVAGVPDKKAEFSLKYTYSD
ncbi:hypothetical protein [Streptomyces sp. NPDC048111]|uniref:hypothetical protein n=1 Tax=Streptomyces sp. NPDC048111 TaxID=3365500 RepID=UPI0037136DC0